MKLILAGGGTGGHIFPGISVAKKILKEQPESKVLVICSRKKSDKKFFIGFDSKEIFSRSWQPKMRKIPRFLLDLTFGLFQSSLHIERFKPDVIIGLGGYSSVAPCMIGRLFNIPVVLLEQNAIPGKATRLISKFAKKVYFAWEGTERYLFNPRLSEWVGNPVREEIINCKAQEGYDYFNLSAQKRTILVMGGSQGAKNINQNFVNSLDRLDEYSNELQIIHSSGELNYKFVKLHYENSRIDSYCVPFIKRIDIAYSIADLIICRAGGTTLSEITAVGIPAILVPYPWHNDRHQYENAKKLVDNEAGVILDESDFSPRRILELINGILFDPEKLAMMKRRSKELGKPNAVKYVAENILYEFSRN